MKIITIVILFGLPFIRASCQYPPAAGEEGSRAIFCDSSIITGWASYVHIERGFLRIDDSSLGYATSGEEIFSTGKADNLTVSLGDGGIAIAQFNVPIIDVNGSDFAIFENSFDGKFLELATVEVSSDSIKWVMFPPFSDTDTSNQVGSFGMLNPEKLYNLAGKYIALYGTPFELNDLKDSSGIDINNINYIRITDVVGSVDPRYSTLDSRGIAINDPWPTPFESSGFDLDAIAILDDVEGAYETFNNEQILIYPNPVGSDMKISRMSAIPATIIIYNMSGISVIIKNISGNKSIVRVNELSPGPYIFSLITGDKIHREIFIKR